MSGACDPKERGYKIIKGNTRNGDYANFCGTDEQGIAYNEIMSIQAHDILTAITEDHKVDIDIAYGQYVGRLPVSIRQRGKNTDRSSLNIEQHSVLQNKYGIMLV